MAMAMEADGTLERVTTNDCGQSAGRSCREAFYGFDGWQTARLNALKTDDSEGNRQA